MRIMSERRFQRELEKAKEEIYQREQADRRMMEIHERIDRIQRDLCDLRRKVEGRPTTMEPPGTMEAQG